MLHWQSVVCSPGPWLPVLAAQVFQTHVCSSAAGLKIGQICEVLSVTHSGAAHVGRLQLVHMRLAVCAAELQLTVLQLDIIMAPRSDDTYAMHCIVLALARAASMAGTSCGVSALASKRAPGPGTETLRWPQQQA